jgi:hypothetical protein
MKRIIAAAALMFASQAHAAFWDGNTLYKNLQEQPSLTLGAAYGFVMGVHDLGEHVIHCSPENTKAKEVIEVVREFLEFNASERGKEAQELVSAALKFKWPCKKKTGVAI